MLFGIIILQCLFLLLTPHAYCQQSQKLLQSKYPDTKFVQYDLEKFLNNKGFAPDGNLDDLGNHFVCDSVKSNSVQIGTIPYTISKKAHRDNAFAQGQVITVNESLGALYLLVTASHGPVRAQIVVTYQDGSTTSTLLQVPDWQVAKITTYDAISCTVNTGATGYLLSMAVYIDPKKPVSHLTLPYASGTLRPTLHLFGLTGVTSTAAHVVSAVATSDFDEQQETSSRCQYIKVRVHNTGTQWLQDIKVEISGPLLKTKQPGKITKLAPGSISQSRALIHTLRRKPTPTAVFVRLYKDEILLDEQVVTVNIGFDDYSATQESLSQHGAPKWYQDAKFGIFIHWGVYSVPAYAPPYQYAEWYWYQLHQVDGPTYLHHQDVYGTSFEYDDFIKQWDPAHFDAAKWLQVVNASQATYFVFTTKHHDGVALFDTKVTGRSSVHFKGRDFAKEIFETAKEQYPHLKRGFYFSIPEWYHPSYHDSWLGWHGPPLNPFTGAQAPYTGAPPVGDFVNDVQLPQALELIDNYQPDIFWCDIGGINNSSVWQSHYFNSARIQGKQVVINDRCGNGIWDFATVEYRQVFDPPPTTWESTRGIDPFSFGYNRATSLDRYTSTTALIQELVNVVAKGGNLLLNIGPEGSGRIPDVMVDRLVGIGQWLQKVHPSIFDSEPYWVTPEDDKDPGQQLRFTVKRDGSAFYIFSLQRPVAERVFIKAPVPYIHPRMQASLLADKKVPLNWNMHSNGRLVLYVPNSALDRAEHVWVFELSAPC